MKDKILCLADLHIDYAGSYELAEVKQIIKEEKPSLVLIAGDVFENSISFNPYKELAKLKAPVIFCLGNHEFAYRSVTDTIKFYIDKYKPERYDVHCLDVIGHREVEFNGKKLNVIGNVLWYDGSLKDVLGQPDEIVDGWLDRCIISFDYKAENARCRKQILESVNDDDTILLTHCVPHVQLNMFSLEKPSVFNMYSGMNDFLKTVKERCAGLKWSVCGHTHRRTNATLYGVNCINIGNDYLMRGGKIKYFIIEEI